MLIDLNTNEDGADLIRESSSLSNTNISIASRLIKNLINQSADQMLIMTNYSSVINLYDNYSSPAESADFYHPNYQLISMNGYNASAVSLRNLSDNPFGANLSTDVSNSIGAKSDLDKLNEFMSDLRSQVLVEKIIYSLLFLIGSFGNLFVLYNLFQPRFKSKMNYLIRHLAIADLMVIFLTIGVELIWRFTIKWETGEFGCKIVQFWRIFPLYLTSLMMICISLDRFYAFVFPLTIFKSKERNFYLIVSSYIVSFVASIPQVSF